MKKVLSLLKPYRLHMVVAWLLMLVELMVELFQPLFLAKIIDQGVLVKNTSIIWMYGIIMVTISLIAFVAGIINSFYSSHVSQSYGFDLRERLFEKVQSFSYANFNQYPTSSLITRMTNDVTQMQNTAFMGLRIMMRAPLLVIGSIIMAFVVNMKLAIFFVIGIVILLPFLLWILKKGGNLFKFVQEKVDQVNSVMRENLSGIRLIKAFVRDDYEVNRFTKANKQLRERTVSAFRLMQTIMPVLLFVMNIAILLALWFGQKQVSTNHIKIGEVVAIINYGMRMTAAFSMLTFIIMAFSRARASANRIASVLNVDISMTDSIDQINSTRNVHGNVTFDHVSFHYPGHDRVVLKDISFDVQPGSTISILGATGSGKTSLFQLIPRLYDVTEGMVLVDQQDVRDMRQEVLRQHIGYVPQESLLFTGTIKENIIWGKADATIEEITEAARDAQILDTINQLPSQFDTKIGQKGINLSGGQKQRLAIARALVRKPKILLLDDSTSALDLETESKLLSVLKKYQCTTFIITQKISTAMAADDILILEDGLLIARGPHDDIIKNTPVYKKIYESQVGEGSSSHA